FSITVSKSMRCWGSGWCCLVDSFLNPRCLRRIEPRRSAMHIEPGLVDGTKIFLSYATAAGALGYAAKLSLDAVKKDGVLALLLRAAVATALVFAFFELLPHHAVGVSEVHLILGTTLLLVFGVAPSAIGLAAGLLIQSVFFAQSDLPQYGMNVTTLLLPLFVT